MSNKIVVDTKEQLLGLTTLLQHMDGGVFMIIKHYLGDDTSNQVYNLLNLNTGKYYFGVNGGNYMNLRTLINEGVFAVLPAGSKVEIIVEA